MAYIRTPDGCVLDESGRVVYFGLERFVRDICQGDCCFICGAERSAVPFNDEHIFPQWLLRRYRLHDRFIGLPNLTQSRYGQYVIPCCETCNSRMGEMLEAPISRLIQRGAEAVITHLRQHGALFFFTWFALIFIKTHLKDRSFRMDRDMRKEDWRIGDLYEWQELHHIHCVARSFYSGAILTEEAYGSLVVLPASTAAYFEPFDYGDLYQPRSLFLRLDDVCFIVVLNDSNGALSGLVGLMEKISGPLSPVQIRELFIRFAYANMRLTSRPSFASSFGKDSYEIVARRPQELQFQPGRPEEYGALLYHATKPVLDQLATPNRDQIIEGVKAGNWTFLFGPDGHFAADSMRPVDETGLPPA